VLTSAGRTASVFIFAALASVSIYKLGTPK